MQTGNNGQDECQRQHTYFVPGGVNPPNSKPDNETPVPRTISRDEIDAWVCQQNIKRHMMAVTTVREGIHDL